MKEFEIKAQVRACQWDELSPEQQRLIAVAKEQTERSYCPYSQFHVGAAAELGNGVADMHCFSDEYLADELLIEFGYKK